jgi:hypothetical protein
MSKLEFVTSTHELYDRYASDRASAFVYQWTDSSNGMKYIGFHKGTIDDGYTGSGKHFKLAYKKRPACFSREIIATGSIDEMLELETFILEEIDSISKLANNPNYYNMQANVRNSIDYPTSEETRQKLSAANKGKPSPLKGRKTNKPSPMKGRKQPKTSAALKGRPSPMKGNSQSDEARLKISAALKGRPSPMKGKKNPAVSAAHSGRIPWNKGIPSPDLAARNKDRRGKPNAAVSAALKGRPSPLKGMTRDEYRRMKEGNIL